jgi:DNA-binding transcriptional LysR family regulator
MDTSKLDLNLLVTLEALLAERNVTKAAARLALSQPAVSAQLARLRTVLRDPLLLPAQRGMTPTAKALELHEPLRQALDQVRAAVSNPRSFDPHKARLTVAIAASDYVQAAVLQPLVLALRQQAPQLRVALRTLDAVQLQEQMARGDVDLALITPQSSPAALRSRHLYDEHFVLVARQGHPLLKRCKAGTAPTLAQFAALEHVLVSPRGGAFSSAADTALASLGHKRQVVLSAASFLFVPGIVAQSDLVALVPSRLVPHPTAQLQVLACPMPVPGFAIQLLWHERGHAHAGQRWVREQLLAAAGAAPV